MILLCDNRRRTESVFDFIRIDTVFSSIYLYLHSKNESGRYHCSSSYRFWFIYFPFGNVSKQDQELKMNKLFSVVVKREMLLLYFSWNLLGASTSLYEYINYVVQKVNVLTHRNHVSIDNIHYYKYLPEKSLSWILGCGFFRIEFAPDLCCNVCRLRNNSDIPCVLIATACQMVKYLEINSSVSNIY